jgi:hypothetical protein
MAVFVVVYFKFNHSPPAIARGIVLGPRGGPNERLTASLRSAFPNGAKEESLRAALVAQGFEALPPPPADCLPAGQRPTLGKAHVFCYDDKRILQYKWSNSFVCGETISVSWRSDDRGEVVDAKAVYFPACL